MRFIWHRRGPGEFDHEAIWGGLGLFMLLAARFFPFQKISLNICWFHRLTGLPCPSCGGTRAFAALTRGHFADGFRLNPLASIGFYLLLLYVSYCAWTLLFQRPRLRLKGVSGRERAIPLIFASALIGGQLGLSYCRGKVTYCV